MNASTFATARVFSRSLFKVIESQILSKKRWCELLHDLPGTEMELKPLNIIGDVVVMKAKNFKHSLIIMNATELDLLLHAFQTGGNTAAILSSAVFQHEHGMIKIISSWQRGDEKERKKIVKQFNLYLKTLTPEQRANCSKWVKQSVSKKKSKTIFLNILRSKKNGK